MTDKKKTKKIEQNFSDATTDRKKERIQRIKRLTRVRRRLWLQISPPTKGYRDLRRRLYLPRSPSVWTCIHLLRSPSLWWRRFLGFLVFVVFVLMMMSERKRNYSCWLNHHPKKEWMCSSSRKKRWKRRTRCVLPRRRWKMMPRASWTSFVLVVLKEVFCVTFFYECFYFCFFAALFKFIEWWHQHQSRVCGSVSPKFCVCCSFFRRTEKSSSKKNRRESKKSAREPQTSLNCRTFTHSQTKMSQALSSSRVLTNASAVRCR